MWWVSIGLIRLWAYHCRANPLSALKNRAFGCWPSLLFSYLPRDSDPVPSISSWVEVWEGVILTWVEVLMNPVLVILTTSGKHFNWLSDKQLRNWLKINKTKYFGLRLYVKGQSLIACFLALWVLLKCSLSAFWVLSEFLFNALWLLWVILKSS